MSDLQIYNLMNNLFYLVSLLVMFLFISVWLKWVLRLKDKDKEKDKSKMSKDETRRKKNQEIIDRYMK